MEGNLNCHLKKLIPLLTVCSLYFTFKMPFKSFLLALIFSETSPVFRAKH